MQGAELAQAGTKKQGQHKEQTEHKAICRPHSKGKHKKNSKRASTKKGRPRQGHKQDAGDRASTGRHKKARTAQGANRAQSNLQATQQREPQETARAKAQNKADQG